MINLNNVYLLSDSPSIFMRVKTWTDRPTEESNSQTVFDYVRKIWRGGGE